MASPRVGHNWATEQQQLLRCVPPEGRVITLSEGALLKGVPLGPPGGLGGGELAPGIPSPAFTLNSSYQMGTQGAPKTSPSDCCGVSKQAPPFKQPHL